MNSPVFAFEVWAVGNEDCKRTINTVSKGAAKYDYLLDVRDCWPDIKYTDLRARKIGAPHTSDQFIRNAIYRGMPDVRCGDRVTVEGRPGTIVGHNDSANFEVLFDKTSDWGSMVLNCHPGDITRAAAEIARAADAGKREDGNG